MARCQCKFGLEVADCWIEVLVVGLTDIGRVGCDEVELAGERRSPVSGQEVAAVGEIEVLGVCSCDFEGRFADVCTDADGIWALSQDGEKDRAGASAEIQDFGGCDLERALDDEFGFGSWD